MTVSASLTMSIWLGCLCTYSLDDVGPRSFNCSFSNEITIVLLLVFAACYCSLELPSSAIMRLDTSTGSSRSISAAMWIHEGAVAWRLEEYPHLPSSQSSCHHRRHHPCPSTSANLTPIISPSPTHRHPASSRFFLPLLRHRRLKCLPTDTSLHRPCHTTLPPSFLLRLPLVR